MLLTKKFPLLSTTLISSLPIISINQTICTNGNDKTQNLQKTLDYQDHVLVYFDDCRGGLTPPLREFYVWAQNDAHDGDCHARFQIWTTAVRWIPLHHYHIFMQINDWHEQISYKIDWRNTRLICNPSMFDITLENCMEGDSPSGDIQLEFICNCASWSSTDTLPYINFYADMAYCVK